MDLSVDNTLIVLLLDRSGSMSSIRDEIISGVNSYVENQASVEGKASIFVAQFDNEYEVLSEYGDVGKFSPLTRETYVPRGTTAYYESMIKTIDDVGTHLRKMPKTRRPTKILFVAVSDGQENASGEGYTGKRLSEMIKTQSDIYSWEFVFIGSNQESIKDNIKLGISKQSLYSYDGSARGTLEAFDALNCQTVSYRTTDTVARGAFWGNKDAE